MVYVYTMNVLVTAITMCMLLYLLFYVTYRTCGGVRRVEKGGNMTNKGDVPESFQNESKYDRMAEIWDTVYDYYCCRLV